MKTLRYIRLSKAAVNTQGERSREKYFLKKTVLSLGG